MKGSNNPNIKAKQWAQRLQDETLGHEAISLPVPSACEQDETDENVHTGITPTSERNNVKLQCERMDGYTIVGNDVEALFPSLLDVESARITREAVMASELEIENMDFETALKYLVVAGGKKLV